MFDLTKEELKQIIDTAPAITYVAKAYGDFGAKFVSSNIMERCGYSVQECIDNPNFWEECLHPDEKEMVLEGFQDIFQEGKHTHEYRFRKKDGTYMWVLDELHLNYDEDGNPYEIIGSWLDISKLKNTEENLIKTKNLFHDFFLNNPIPTTISTFSGVMRYVNPAFTELTGYTSDEVIGRSFKDLSFWGDLKLRQKMFSEIKEKGVVNGFEAVLCWKNNKPFNCLINSKVVEIDNEKLLLSTATDIANQKEIEEKLRKLDKSKNNFISMAAHELNTPITCIMGYVELLSDEEMSRNLSKSNKAEFFEDITSNCDFLSKAIDDLLFSSRIDSGKSFPLEKRRTEFRPLISKIIKRFRLTFDREIVIHFEEGCPRILNIDPHRMSQVIENILSNSIKYSPPKSLIKLVVTKDVNQCSFSVIDKGIGMSPEEISHIFDKFYRADESNITVRGLGLGMSIVKRIIIDHDGDIAVESTPQEGTTVKFKIPLN
jgi:PAS domain S-box-containing protein